MHKNCASCFSLHKNCARILALAKFLHNSYASFFLCKSCSILLFYFILTGKMFAQFLCKSCRFYFIILQMGEPLYTWRIKSSSSIYNTMKIWNNRILQDLHNRDGPKFCERRTSAEEFGRTFGSVRLGNVWTIRPNFGRTLAKIWRHFAVLRLRRFALIWSHCTL